MMSNDDDIGLAEAYAVRTPEDNRRLYAKWAATYESGFVDAHKYRYPKAIAELFDEVIPTVATVVDCGAGTGLVGLYLSALRPAIAIDAIDISPEMLDEAVKKVRSDGTPCYRALFERDLTRDVNDVRAPYDALISSGTFTHGHLGPDAIDHLLPLVGTGGYFVIGANAEHFAARGFEAHLLSLAGKGLISTPEFQKIHVYEPGSPHYGDQSVVSRFQRR